MRRAHIRDPIAHRFVDRVLERARAGIDAHHFRAQQTHAEDVEPLALHVIDAHVDYAFQAQARRNRCRRDSVLARARFRDDAALAHAHGQQALPNAVVDFVRAGVKQVLALDVDTRPAEMLRKPRSKLQRRGAPGKIFEQIVEFSLEARVFARFLVCVLEFLERRHERLRNVAASVRTKAALRVRPSLSCGAHLCLLSIER